MYDNKIILAIDDDKEHLDILCMFLEDALKQDVFCYDNPMTAIGVIETITPDIIIVDYNMPEINGVELATKAKELSSGTKIILMSATNYADIMSNEKGCDVIISAFLRKGEKSFTENLLGAIAKCLQEKKWEIDESFFHTNLSQMQSKVC